MVDAVVFAFAVADGLRPVVGAAPFDVLARQLPRLLVVHLNAGTDRGIRYFPFLGKVGGERAFLALSRRFDPGQLADLHKQGDVRILCDGLLEQGALRWRAIDGRSRQVVRELELPFDPSDPMAVLPRLEFEVMELLGRGGRPHAHYSLHGEAAGWWLIVRDDQLRREAKLGSGDADHALRAAGRCIELAPGAPEVADAVLDLAAHLVQQARQREQVGDLLRRLAAVPELTVERRERLAALLLGIGDGPAAAVVSLHAARAAIEREELVERSVGLLFRFGMVQEAAALVEVARRRGVASVTALAQYAACCDKLGDRARRNELCDEMLREHDLPHPVARLLVSFLLEEDRAVAARDVARRALAADPAHPVLHFELGRAWLSLGDCEHAAGALREALDRGLPGDLKPRAERLLRLASEPGLWRGSQDVELALANGELERASRLVNALVRAAPRVGECWFLAGLVRHKRGDEVRAERALRRALRLDDTLTDAHNRLGILLVARGDAAGGLPHLERAHALAPGESSPMLHLAQALACLGRVGEAERYLERAATVGADPELVEAVRRGVASQRRGRA